MVLKERMRNREGTDYELVARGVTDQHRQCSCVIRKKNDFDMIKNKYELKKNRLTTKSL